GQNVRAFGFCKECVQFLCSDCHNVHGRLQATRQHDVLQGKDMPKSQADKPPRFDCCDVHPKLLKDQFCCDHKILLCSVCSSSKHNDCSIKTVGDVCTIVDVSDTSALYDRVRSLQESLKSPLPTIDKAITELKDQEKTMLHDAQKAYDQIIAEANKKLDTIKNEIQMSCQSQTSVLSQQRKQISDLRQKLDAPLTLLGEVKGKPVDTKLFLRLQENVSYTKKLANKLQELSRSLKFISLSFIPSQPSQEILSSSFTLGKIRKSESNPPGADIKVREIMFPVSVLKQTAAQPNAGPMPPPQNIRVAVAKHQLVQESQPVRKIKATKQDTYNIRIGDDTRSFWITGMAITKDKRILMTDNGNRKIMMFSHDMKFLSSVAVSDRPQDIAVISDKEAVVTTHSKSLVMLGISGSQLRIKTTTQLSYDVFGICRYNDRLVVTSPYSYPLSSSVKLIDKAGGVYWSVLSDKQGQPLFNVPLYVSSPGDGRSSTVIVTDEGNHTLILLNGDTGEVITRRQLKEKYPRGVTTDSDGNVYVCYWETSEMAVLSGDLSEKKILLSRQNGLSSNPKTITYDHTTHLLTISYDPHFSFGGYDKVDRFKLS
ncbi:MAG: hypothetical protein AB2693_32965, partial [Candidatus Thiodiazotropha sp.]